MEEFHITKTKTKDIEDIVSMAIDFFNESCYAGLTYDSEKYREILLGNIDNHYVGSFVCRDNEEKLMGFVHVFAQNSFTKELIGELYQFFVCKEARGTKVARMLVEKACKQFDEWGCARSYCETSAGFSDERNMGYFKNNYPLYLIRKPFQVTLRRSNF